MPQILISVLSEKPIDFERFKAALNNSGFSRGYFGSKTGGLLNFLLHNAGREHVLFVRPALDFLNICNPINLRQYCIVDVVLIGPGLPREHIPFVQKCMVGGYIDPETINNKQLINIVNSLKKDGYFANKFIPLELWENQPKHVFPRPKPSLTEGEEEVLLLLCHNYSIKQIAERLHKKEPAIRARIRKIKDKLYADSIREIITIVMANMWYPHDPDLANGDSPYFGKT